MTAPDASGPALPDPTRDPAEKIAAEPISTHYDIRLPELPWSRRIQIPFIAAAVYGVIRILGPTLRYEVLGWQNAERVHAALGGGDDGAAVAGAEIVVDVTGRQLGDVEHLFDQGLRRRHPDDVLAGLPDLGFVFLGKCISRK